MDIEEGKELRLMFPVRCGHFCPVLIEFTGGGIRVPEKYWK